MATISGYNSDVYKRQVPDSVTSVDSLDLFVNISGTNYQITL